MLEKSQINEFLELYEKYLKDNIQRLQSLIDKKEPPKINEEDFKKSVGIILTDLVRNPGGLIYVEDKEMIPAYRLTIDAIYEMYSDSDILNMLSNGDFEGYINEIEDDIAGSLRDLKPTFVSIKPSNEEFYVLYNEAMKCWLHGLANSAVILSATLLENLLKDQMTELNPERILAVTEGNNRNNGFKNAIDVVADEGLLSLRNKRKAHNLRRKRNKVIHNGLAINPSTAFELIRDTKEILEEILN